MPATRRRRTREEILQELARVGRENSDATGLFHAATANRLELHPTDYKATSIVVMFACAIGHLHDVAMGPEIREYLERIDADLVAAARQGAR